MKDKVFRKLRVRTEYLLAGLAAAATFLVYLHTLQNGFVSWDDDKYIIGDPYIHRLNLSFLKWSFSSFYLCSWHPLTWISYALDYSAWRLNPAGYHLTGIIFHSANTFIAVVLTVRLIDAWEKTGGRSAFLEGKGKLIAGAAVGLLFGLHPLHVESVAWASERKDVLSAFFFMLSILAYLKYARSKNMLAYTFSLGLFAFALMSKPMAASLPIVLFILDWYPLDRIRSFKTFRNVFIEKLPFVLFSFASFAMTRLALTGIKSSPEFTPLPARALVAIKSLAAYLWKMALPLDLVPYYPYPSHIGLFSLRYLLPALFVAVMTATCLIAAKRHRLWLAIWGYYVATLMPVIIVVLRFTPVGEKIWLADRYTYLPSLGPFLVVGIAAAWVWEKIGAMGRLSLLLRSISASAAFLAVLTMAYLTFSQIGVWKNSLVFWDYVIGQEPGKIAIAYFNRGNFFRDNGQFEDAIADYSKAISLEPYLVRPYLDRGIAFGMTGRAKKAIADFNMAIALDPSSPKAYYDLGLTWAKSGRFELAIPDFNKTIALDPRSSEAYNNLGIVFERIGQLDKALNNFRMAIVLQPANAEAYVNIGSIYMRTGQERLAASDFRKACAMGNENGCLALQQRGY